MFAHLGTQEVPGTPYRGGGGDCFWEELPWEKFCPKFGDSIFSAFLRLGTEFFPPFLRKVEFPLVTLLFFLRRFAPWFKCHLDFFPVHKMSPIYLQCIANVWPFLGFRSTPFVLCPQLGVFLLLFVRLLMESFLKPRKELQAAEV